MKILAIEKEVDGVKDEDYKPHLKNEAIRVWELYQSGEIREIYFTDKDYAVLVLECGSLTEARNILSTLPLVKEGLIDFNILPLKAYSGFERLFSSN